MNKFSHPTSGFALILSLLITSIALAIGLSLLDVTLKQITLSTSARESEVAFQAAAAGMECLRNIRDESEADILNSEATLNVDCFDDSLTFNRNTPLSNGSFLDVYQLDNYDWAVDPNTDRCIQMEIYVYDATSGDRNISIGGRDLTNTTCVAGNICTVAFSRGHNRSCAEVANPNTYAVQRELTAEF